jgi:hypothetical protein
MKHTFKSGREIEVVIDDQALFDKRDLMNPEDKQLWIQALNSGEYKQGTGQLVCKDYYCCLGVFCEVKEVPKGGLNSFRFTSENLWANLPPSFLKPKDDGSGRFQGFCIPGEGIRATNLAELNDTLGFTFPEIAEIVEMFL